VHKTSVAFSQARAARPADPVSGIIADDGCAGRDDRQHPDVQVMSRAGLDADTQALARWLTADQLLNLLLPVRDDRPGWMRPSTSKGWLGITLACLNLTP
jgi:hypothetical protein